MQSAYNFVRGGDIDEIRIYDRMLSDDNVAALARGDAAGAVPALTPHARGAGVARRVVVPLRLESPRRCPAVRSMRRRVGMRKVEIHDVYDLKRWWWKATDGIRETTWPGVYNRSRLPGRNDYFQLPDWDCYSLSGKSVTFTMPDEPWNHLEISGAAWGAVTLRRRGRRRSSSGRRARSGRCIGLAEAIRGEQIRFANVEQETPIGELCGVQRQPRARAGGHRPADATA